MRKVAYRLAALAVGLVMGLLLAEFTLRVSDVWIGRHSDTMFTLVEYDPYLGWRMKPNLNSKVDLVDVEGIPVRTNTQGFWDKEFNLAKPGNACRIVFLGDSFTWGMGVREEERFTNLLQKANPKWDALNFGIPGYGTDQELLLWQRFAHSYRPNLVVLTVYQNDYQDNMYLVRYGRPKPYFEITKEGELLSKGVPVERTDFWKDTVFNQAAPPYERFFEEPVQKRSRIIHWLAKNSDLARFLYTFWRGIHTPSERFSEPTISPRPLADVKKEEVRLLEALVNQLAQEVHAQGAEFIILFAGHLTPQHQAVMGALRETGITFIDGTSTVLGERVSSSNEGVYYRFSKHWTSAAHKAVAAILSSFIQGQRICASVTSVQG